MKIMSKELQLAIFGYYEETLPLENSWKGQIYLLVEKAVKTRISREWSEEQFNLHIQSLANSARRIDKTIQDKIVTVDVNEIAK